MEYDIETTIPRSWKEKCRYFYWRNYVVIYCLIAIACGFIVGFVLKVYFSLSTIQKVYLHFPGDLFMSILVAMSVCFISSSVLAGLCSLGRVVSRRVALKTGVFVLATSALAIAEGIILAEVIQPGRSMNVTKIKDQQVILFTAVDAIMDFIRNLVPRNYFGAFFRKYATSRSLVPKMLTSNSSPPVIEYQEEVVGSYVSGSNLLGLISGSFVIGYSIIISGTHAKIMADLVLIVNNALKRLSRYIRVILPIGLFFVTISTYQEIESWDFYVSQSLFLYTVSIGLLFHTFVALPFIFWLLTNCNFFSILSKSYTPILGGLFLSSSSATMPITSECCEERLKINKSLTRVMVPIVTTMNMNGTLIYEAIAVLYVAQLHDIPLSITHRLVIGMLVGLGTIGSPAVPAVGAVATIFACNAIGLPTKDTTWLVLLETLFDRFNTVVNIIGDIMGVALLHSMSKMDLRDLEVETMETIELEDLDPDFIVAVH